MECVHVGSYFQPNSGVRVSLFYGRMERGDYWFAARQVNGRWQEFWNNTTLLDAVRFLRKCHAFERGIGSVRAW